MSIPKEVREVAQQIRKSEKALERTPEQETLVKTIIALGPEAIQKSLPSLGEEECVMVRDALKEIQKSVAVDEGENAKFVQGNVYKDTIIQEDKVDDDIDETLVKPEAAAHNHQGDRTPKGIDNHEISDPKDTEKKGDAMKKSTDSSEIYKAIFSMAKAGKDKSYMEGAMIEKGNPAMIQQMIDFALMEHNVDLHPESYEARMEGGASEGVEQAMYSDIYKMMGDGRAPSFMRGFGMMKGYEPQEMEKAMEHAGEHPKYKGTYGKSSFGKGEMKDVADKIDKASGEMKGNLKNPEESQVKDDLESLHQESARGDKSRPKHLKIEDENKAAQKKVNDLNQGDLKKAVNWAGPNAMLEGGRGGQTHHFSVNGFYDEAIEKVMGIGKNPVKKSKGDSEVSTDQYISDTIEKGEAQSRETIIAESIVKAQRTLRPETSLSSFDVGMIGDMIGMTKKSQEEALAS